MEDNAELVEEQTASASNEMQKPQRSKRSATNYGTASLRGSVGSVEDWSDGVGQTS